MAETDPVHIRAREINSNDFKSGRLSRVTYKFANGDTLELSPGCLTNCMTLREHQFSLMWRENGGKLLTREEAERIGHRPEEIAEFFKEA